MGDEILQHMRAEYPDLAAHIARFDHTTPLGAEARRLLNDLSLGKPLPFKASAPAISFLRRRREREILDALKAARRGR